MNGQEQKTCFAIAGIVVIESVALLSGIDGTILIASVSVIAGLGGYSAAKSKSLSAFIDKHL